MATREIERRTVLVVGKAGAGKSTVCNKLVNSDEAFQVEKGYDNPVHEIMHKEVTIPLGTNKEYNLKVIDSVGFFGPKISNKASLDKLKNFLQTNNNVQGINLVLFVFRDGRLTLEEKECFKYLLDNFKDDISNISALVITHCDNVDDEDRQTSIQEFKDNEVTKSTAEFMKGDLRRWVSKNWKDARRT